VIANVAGTGIFGFTGDGMAATKTQFAYPVAIAIDSIGNLYVTDQRNHRIRVIDRNTGKVDTVAGCGRIGSDGDGGPALEAQLDMPVGVVLDANGNCYFVEQHSARIRRVDGNDGTIATIGASLGRSELQSELTLAGGLSRPSFLALVRSGEVLLVCDQDRHQICAVTLDGETMRPVAGTGRAGSGGDGGPPLAAELNNPNGIALSDSHVYVADQWNHRVRRFDLGDVGGLGIEVLAREPGAGRS
jgi:DNA-binding beta-propeller fold protein YncE